MMIVIAYLYKSSTNSQQNVMQNSFSKTPRMLPATK